MLGRIRMTVAQLKKHLDSRFKTSERRMNRRFAAVDARFTGVDGRFARVEGRLTGVEARLAGLEGRFDAMDARLDRTDARMAAGFESLDAKLDALFRMLKDEHDHHTRVVDNHEDRLRDLERATAAQGA
jgi:chromosome segregation ATPase